MRIPECFSCGLLANEIEHVPVYEAHIKSMVPASYWAMEELMSERRLGPRAAGVAH